MTASSSLPTGLCLGGNVFGWTADEPTSFALLDAFVDAGGSMIDTADSYMARAEGLSGGESETVIGRWLARRGKRDDVVIATKVGSWAEHKGLGPDNIRAACDDSLRRLQTDHIDLYYAHRDDPDTPQEDYLEAFDGLVRAGKVRAIGASNFDADRLASALELSDKHDLARFTAVQPHYNLVERAYEAEQRAARRARGPRLLPVLRARQGLPDGQVPPRGRRGGHGRGQRHDGERPRRGRPELPRRPRGRAARGARRDRRGARRADRRGLPGVARGAAHGRGTHRECTHPRPADARSSRRCS